MAVVSVVLAAMALSGTAGAAAGDLDPRFGTGGKVTTDFGDFAEEASAVAIQANGKIVVAGSGSIAPSDFMLARYKRDGRLDPSFGSGGKVTTGFGGSSSDDRARAIAIQADGKIVAVGSSNASGHTQFALARYRRDGSLDPSFGSGGKVTTGFHAASVAHGVAIQADGKIVTVGGAGRSDFALARYRPDGSLDPSFGSGGKVRTDFSGSGSYDGASAVVIQPDGKIVAAGLSDAVSGHEHFALARYLPDGSLDPSFGSGGKVLTDFGGNSVAGAVAIQADGKIVAAGAGGVGAADFALARYLPDGSLDPSFGSGGTVLTGFGNGGSLDYATGVAIQTDGKIVAVGVSDAHLSTGEDFALARYEPNGSLDPSFGKVLTDFSGDDDRASAVAIQPDGKIIAAGSSVAPGGEDDFALARYRAGAPAPLKVAIDIKPGAP